MSDFKNNLKNFKDDNCWARTCGPPGTLDNLKSIYELPQCPCKAKSNRMIEYNGIKQMGRVCGKHKTTDITNKIGFYNYPYKWYNPECLWPDGSSIIK